MNKTDFEPSSLFIMPQDGSINIRYKQNLAEINIMSKNLFAKVFGSGEKGGKPCTPQESIQRLREIEEMLQKKSEFLEKKIEQEVAFAKKNGTKNRKGISRQ